jgi:hypothetical protein
MNEDYLQYTEDGLFDYSSAGDAAISVAVMLGVATIILVVLKQSGFRAMIAVGRS